MNLTQNELITNPDRKEACDNIDDPVIQKEIKEGRIE